MVLSAKVGRLNGKASGKRFLMRLEASACDWLWLPRMKMPRHRFWPPMKRSTQDMVYSKSWSDAAEISKNSSSEEKRM